MNCFLHPDRVAVGSCKACQKGLCVDCAVDLGLGLACRNSHETQVEEVNWMIEHNISVTKKIVKLTYMQIVNIVLIVVLGVAMIIGAVRADYISILEFLGGYVLAWNGCAILFRRWLNARAKRAAPENVQMPNK